MVSMSHVRIQRRSACRDFSILALIDFILDLCLSLLRFCLRARLWYCASIPLSADHEIVVITCSAFSDCHPVAPFWLQPPGAGVTLLLIFVSACSSSAFV